MCKVPVCSRHLIQFNKFKSIGCYHVPQILLYMNYGEYKTHEIAYNLKEISTFEDRLKHA